MASSTISPRVVLTDDSGTFAAPNNDGTVVNNALFQTLQDRIDALFSGDLHVGGLVVDTFGAHPVFVASGAGTNSLEVRNLAAGTGNTAAYLLGNDVASGRGSLAVTASNWAPTGGVPADAVVLDTAGAGGIVLRSSGASAGVAVRSLLPIEFLVNGVFNVSMRGDSGRGLVVQGTPYVGADVTGVYLAPNCTGATSIAAGLDVNPALAGQYLYGSILRAPAITGAYTHASTLTLVGPPTGGTGGQTFALEIGAGRVWNSGQYTSANGTADAPMYSFLAAPATGLFLDPSTVDWGGNLRVSLGGAVCLEAGRFGGGETYLKLGATVAELGANHTDFVSVTGDTILLGADAENATQVIIAYPQNIQLPNAVALSGSNYLHVLGAGNSIARTSSSARYKTAIADLVDDDPWRVLRLRPRLYEDAARVPGVPRRQFAGLIAEEVAEVLPMLVVANAEGTPENVMYDRLPVYLLRALGVLVQRVEALEGRAP